MNQRGLLGLAALTAVFLVLVVVLASEHAQKASALEGVATVNWRGNREEEVCGGPPNNNLLGNSCALRTAIRTANDGEAHTIAFHPDVFSASNQGVIHVGDPFMQAGCLPPITRTGVTVDLSGAALSYAPASVVVDGAHKDGTNISCSGALVIAPTDAAFEFTFTGQGLTLRNFAGHGITIACTELDTPNYLRGIDISGVSFENISGQSIHNECFSPGDVNCDIVIDGTDSSIVLQQAAGFEPAIGCSHNADPNGDGLTNSLDAAIILQYSAGLIDEF